MRQYLRSKIGAVARRFLHTLYQFVAKRPRLHVAIRAIRFAPKRFSDAISRGRVSSAEPDVPANARPYRAEDVVIALPPDAQAVLSSSSDAPVVDAAPVEVSQTEPPSSSAIDVIYRLGGYPALLAARGPGGVGGQDFAGSSYPNVTATLGGEAGLAELIKSARGSHPLGTGMRAIESVDISETALIIAENQSGAIAPRLLVDLSSLVRDDAGGGIQRVIKAILTHVLTEKHEWRVEPIYRDGDIYRYARKFCCRFLNVDAGDLTDAVVDFHPSDTFLGLDLDAELTEPAANILLHHRQRGMRTIFIIYDLLPILRGDWFGPHIAGLMNLWFLKVVGTADHLIAISRSVADDIVAFIDHLPEPPAPRPIVSWWHLGSDFMVTAAPHRAAQTLNQNDSEALDRLEGRTVFLTVGTIEPRKGIGQLLDAADDLWRAHDATFVIVGKEGWLVDDVMQRMKAHPEFGSRLIWFDRPSDLVLGRLYGLATAALLPSEGEGFGLPLIEAARRNTPIIARDIPVFREIGGSSVFYFTAKSGRELSAALRDWVALHRRGEAPKPELKVATWRESAEQLLSVIRSADKSA
jgi:glycosyltransferase involved in cell wall biosynthesis